MSQQHRRDGRLDGSVRLAVVASHPIQYYAPFYRALTQKSAVKVHAIFASKIGVEKTVDREMGIELAWKTDLLGGYSHEFLPHSGAMPPTGFFMDAPAVPQALSRCKPDAVLLHGYATIAMLRALLWCRKQGVPALMISDSALHSGARLPAKLCKRAALPLIFRQFSAFLSVGDANQRYLETFGVPSGRIFRVPNMVDEGFWTHRGRRAAERLKWRSVLGLEEQDLALLFVGKLIARKRPADILSALERVAGHERAHRPVKAFFAGDGEERSALETAAQGKNLPAQFLGFVNIDELPGHYCAADVLVHPAEIETFGMIALEAAVVGLPLVLSDRVGAIGPASIARPGENALVYPCGDVISLAALLRRLASEPDTLTALGQASLAISKELDWRKSVGGTVAAVSYSLSRPLQEFSSAVCDE